jgi:imidazolonepropionase
MRPDLVVHGISTLLTMDAASGAGALGRLNDAAVAFVDGRVAWVGPSSDAPAADQRIDGSGTVGVPGLVDCHTHAVWAGSRADEWEQRLAGADYTAILERGGGILSTVRATRAAAEDELVELARRRLAGMAARGVTTVEVKSGYGLDPISEPKLLRAAREAGRRAGVRVFTTWLGAHTVPAEHRADRSAYLRELIDVQLPRVVGLADFADVYVDKGAFTLEEGRAILSAARAAGLGVRIHAEQVVFTGSAAMAAALGALSADHLERIDDDGIAAMAKAGTVAVLAPAAMLYLKDTPPPVAKLRAAGVRFAVATDLNPGTSPIHDLWASATLACVTMGLTVEEALLGITAVAGKALGREDLGVLRPGSAGDLVLVEPPAGEPCVPGALLQHLGGTTIRRVVRDGRAV